ncbi:MAG: hypothetical protein IPP63_19260 [Chloracidobacterium sp.]|nr:hypothetical protein [Chloracidobacterium sp.]
MARNVDARRFLDGIDGLSEPVTDFVAQEGQIAADIAKILGRTLRDPKVIVRILDRSNRWSSG